MSSVSSNLSRSAQPRETSLGSDANVPCANVYCDDGGDAGGDGGGGDDGGDDGGIGGGEGEAEGGEAEGGTAAARSKGSHCGGQAVPRTEERAYE